ncbi:MAG: S1 RNA-binding domain-containing protein [Clostridiales bacterium]|nr:S1 RNA-binding domain-containing protein [Clostridiales bacterium]
METTQTDIVTEMTQTDTAAETTRTDTAAETTQTEPAAETAQTDTAAEIAQAEPAGETDRTDLAAETEETTDTETVAETKETEPDTAEESAGTAVSDDASVTETPAESMKDMEKELEASYKMMGDGVHDTDTLLAWSKIMELYEAQTNLTVEISGIVNKGVIAEVEGVRGFIPASRLSLRHVDDLNEWLGKEIQVRIITADQSADKLVLSAREILKEERDHAKQLRISSIEVGSIFDGKVESIQDYGVFVDLGDGVSGLVHVSQIALERVKHPADVLKVGQEVRVKVIGKQNGKLKLSIKALLEQKKQDEEIRVNIPKAESIGTSMGDLLKNLKF